MGRSVSLSQRQKLILRIHMLISVTVRCSCSEDLMKCKVTKLVHALGMVYRDLTSLFSNCKPLNGVSITILVGFIRCLIQLPPCIQTVAILNLQPVYLRCQLMFCGERINRLKTWLTSSEQTGLLLVSKLGYKLCHDKLDKLKKTANLVYKLGVGLGYYWLLYKSNRSE